MTLTLHERVSPSKYAARFNLTADRMRLTPYWQGWNSFQIITKCYCRQDSYDQRDIREISRYCIYMCACVCACVYVYKHTHFYIYINKKHTYTHLWMDDSVLILFWVSVFLRFRASDCFGCFVQWNVVSLPKCGGCPGDQGVRTTGHSQWHHCTAGTVSWVTSKDVLTVCPECKYNLFKWSMPLRNSSFSNKLGMNKSYPLAGITSSRHLYLP